MTVSSDERGQVDAIRVVEAVAFVLIVGGGVANLRTAGRTNSLTPADGLGLEDWTEMFTEMPLDDARIELYEVMQEDGEFEGKAQRALELGRRHLGVENAHLTRIDPETEQREIVATTDSSEEVFPPGLTNNLQATYCRRVIEGSAPLAVHDAPEQGLADDPGFSEQGLHCYYGTSITLQDGLYGTVCFVSRNPRGDPFAENDTLFAELVARVLEYELEASQRADTTSSRR